MSLLSTKTQYQKQFQSQNQSQKPALSTMFYNNNIPSIQKQNISLSSNYSSCNTSTSNQVPKQLLQKAIQMKDQYITQLMNQIKQTKSSYQQFKVKLSQQNVKLKEQNSKLKQKIQNIGKERQNIKKYVHTLEQEKMLFVQKNKSIQEQYQMRIVQLNRNFEQLQEQNKKVSKNINLNEKSVLQFKKDKQSLCVEIQNLKLANLQSNQTIIKIKQEQSKLKEKILQLENENKQLKESNKKDIQKKKDNKKYDRKLERLEEKIANIIGNI